MYSDVVIIGSGHAGGMSAIALRKKKFKGSITIVGQEPYPPYQRPPLSKNFLSNEMDKESLFLKKEGFYRKNNISLLLNTKVEKIIKSKNELVLDNQEILTYKFLILATGSSLIKLKTETMSKQIKYLRNIEDSQGIKEQMRASKKIGIIGSGYIGLEIAVAAIKSKINVTIIEKENSVMNRSVSKQISGFLREKHENNGVKFIFSNCSINIMDMSDHQKLLLDNNQILRTNMLIAGIGVRPKIGLAEKSGLECDDGIKVNSNCQTSDENIFAIGDCASRFNNLYKKHLRLESVQNAVDQAKIVASFLVGENQIIESVPWFWSDQYNVKLQIAGISDNYDKKILKGSIKNEKFTVFYLRKDNLISLETINNAKDFILGKRYIEKQTTINNKEMKKFLNG